MVGPQAMHVWPTGPGSAPLVPRPGFKNAIRRAARADGTSKL